MGARKAFVFLQCAVAGIDSSDLHCAALKTENMETIFIFQLLRCLYESCTHVLLGKGYALSAQV